MGQLGLAAVNSTSAQLRQRAVSGIGWSGAARLVSQAMNFAITVILARLLTPEDFGLIGMIVVFLGFASLFGEFGFGAALVQRKRLEQRHLSSIFWMNLGVSFVLAWIVAALSPLLSWLYSEPRLTPIALIIALSLFLGSIEVVPRAVLERSMEFRRLALVETTSVLISGGLAIGLALAGFGVWSLVWQLLSLTTARAIGVALASNWNPRFRFDWSAVRELIGFSGNLVGFRAFNYWVRNADNLLIGKFLGSEALGIYSRAYGVMLLPVRDVASVLDRVLFSALSRLQDDRGRVKSIYLRAIGGVALITVPVMVSLLVVSENFVLALFGPRWEAMVPILQILCAVGLIQPLNATTGWIYASLGRTDWQFRWGVAAGLTTLIAFGIGVQWGVAGVAIAYLIRVYGLVYFNFEIPGKLIGMRFSEVAHAVAGVFVCAGAMGAAIWALGQALPASWPPWAQLATQLTLGASTPMPMYTGRSPSSAAIVSRHWPPT